MRRKRLVGLLAGVLLLQGCSQGSDLQGVRDDKSSAAQGGGNGVDAGANPEGKMPVAVPFGEEQAKASVLAPEDIGSGWLNGTVDSQGPEDLTRGPIEKTSGSAACDEAWPEPEVSTTGMAEVEYEPADGSGKDVESTVTGYADQQDAEAVMSWTRDVVPACEGLTVDSDGVGIQMSGLTSQQFGDETTALRMTLKRSVDAEGWVALLDVYRIRKGPNVSEVQVSLPAGRTPWTPAEVDALLSVAAAKL